VPRENVGPALFLGLRSRPEASNKPIADEGMSPIENGG
jgi:hypothetical protein